MGYEQSSGESSTTRPSSSVDIAAGETRMRRELSTEDFLREKSSLLSQAPLRSFRSKFFGASRADYSHLPAQSEEEIGTYQSENILDLVHAKKRALWRWRATSILLGITLLSVLFGFWADYLEVRSFRRDSDVTSSTAGLQDMPLSCGNDTAAAVRRDCVFEPLSNRWLPKRCSTALGLHVKPTLKAIDSEPYRFYRDPRGEQEIHEHDWAKIPLETIVWTTERHHFAHCVNLLMQGAAGLAFGGMVEEHARDWNHVKHCADTVLTAAKGLPGWNKINSFVRVRAGECY